MSKKTKSPLVPPFSKGGDGKHPPYERGPHGSIGLTTGSARGDFYQQHDPFPPAQRSWIMSRVQSQNTKPELLVRSLAHRLGYRFRLYRRELPGAPDLVFPSRRQVVFVHGCFWHGHSCKRGARLPKANADYWREKIARNRKRDQKNKRQLQQLGWSVLVLWECQLRDQSKLALRLLRFLQQPAEGREA
jgi:DNA mismatch endonuclease (patch repair protein)